MNAAPMILPELAPIFPLPEVVLFPGQVLPLHIFEPRYRAMVADALAGEKAIAIALLKPDFEQDYFTSHSPIHELVGVGRIIAAEELREGKFNILLRGEARAKLVEELPGRPYRFARIKVVQTTCDASPATRRQVRQELCTAIRQCLETEAEACDEYLQLLEGPFSLGELADLIAGGLPSVGELRQSLLVELNACRRAKLVLEQVRALGAVTHRARQVGQPAEAILN